MTKKIKEALKKIGFSNKEIDMYVFLSKKGAQKGTDIAKQFKMHRGQVYRILKRLEKRSVIETTLEYPKRFLAVPINMVIDSFIITRREEVSKIESSKDDLLSDWQKIKQIELNAALDKFSVIEGESKIFHKISQMVKETKREILSISSVYELLKAEQLEIFNIILHNHSGNKINFRFLTQVTKDDVAYLAPLLERIGTSPEIQGRDPERTSTVFPKMIIRDEEEILLFISDESNSVSKHRINTVICSNSQTIIKSFSSFFEDLWKNASDLSNRIFEIESGKQSSIMELIKDPETAKKKYYEILNKAGEEIVILISSERLIDISNKLNFYKNKSEQGISIKIMAPITCENLKFALNLLKFCEVRHIPVGFREITIIDDKYLFQFNNPDNFKNPNNKLEKFKNLFFTTNLKHIQETKENLKAVWIQIRTPPSITLGAIIRPSGLRNNTSTLEQEHQTLDRLSIFKSREKRGVTKETVDNKFKTLRRIPVPINSQKKVPELARFFGTGGFALIHSVAEFNLPEFILGVFKANPDSAFGEDNHLLVFLKNEEKQASTFEPAAIIQTNPEIIDYRRKVYENTPVENNIRLVEKDKLQILTKGNSLFVAWSFPIPLVPSKHVLPPSCILFEGYGDFKSGYFTNVFPSGRKQDSYYNCLEAFVTYFHPSMKYSIPGTEGFLDKDFLFTSYI